MTQSVLISGASTGIGKALSLDLDQQGYQVFAGVRKPMDAEALRSQASPQLTPLMLDVTQPEMISAACAEVSASSEGGLFCLVNNAGVSLGGSMEFIPIQEFRRQLEVNLVGQLALTQACLPMLRMCSGRIIFISSIAGRLTTPFNGPYSASKAGLGAIADALRNELAPWGIFVSLVILGSVQTPIWEKASHTAGEIARQLPKEAWELYGKWQKRAGGYYRQSGLNGMRVEEVTKSLIHLLEAKRPKEHVYAGQDAVMIEMMSRLVPVRLRDWLIRRRMGLLKP